MGWEFNDYGPDYAGIRDPRTGGEFGGLSHESIASRGAGVLALDRTEDADAALASVLEAGGRVVVTMHDYPGGRRFTFADPSSRDYFPITSVEDLWIRMHLGLQTDITTIIGSSPDTA